VERPDRRPRVVRILARARREEKEATDCHGAAPPQETGHRISGHVYFRYQGAAKRGKLAANVISFATHSTSWHTRLFVRALFGAGLAFALLVLLTALTDEGGLTLAVRVGRTAPLMPFAAALGVGAALAPPRLRGELVAFSSLGQRPTRTVLPAIAGATLVALIVAALLAAHAIDAHGFFPIVPRGMNVTWDGGAFVDRATGVRVLPSGELADSLEGAANATADISELGLPRFAVPVAVTTTFVCSAALAMVAAALRAWSTPLRLMGLAALVGALLAGFQASATTRVSAAVTLVPALVLIALAVVRYRALDALVEDKRERDVVAPHSRRSG
jgi:hypothetical protein